MFKKKVYICTIAFVLIAGCSSRVEIDQNNRGPQVIKEIIPVYPKEAAEKGVEGEVWVKMWIDPNGRVTKAMVEKTPDQSLCNAALDAAMGCKYKPAMMEGKPIGAWLVAPFNVLKKGKK